MENGVFRMVNTRGNGFWIARFKDDEKVFYDGPYGTANASKSAAMKWFNERSKKDEGVMVLDKATELLKWLDEQGEMVKTESVKDKILDIFMPVTLKTRSAP